MELIPFDIEGADGGRIRGEVRAPDRGRDLIPAVMLQDFLLPRSWSFYPFLAEVLARRLCVITFDPSRSGFGPGEDFEAESFQRYTFSSELDDLRRVLVQVRDGKLPLSWRCAPPDRGLALVGHAKGAALSLLHAHEDPSVKGVVCVSAICTMNRLTDQDRSRLLHEGMLPIAEPIQGDRVLLGRTFLEDLRDHPQRFAIERIVRELSLPILFLHGEEDGTVGIEEAETLYHWADKSKSRLVILEKTGHTFGARHPFEGPTKDLEQAAGIVSSFLTGTFGLDTEDGRPREVSSGGHDHPAGVSS